MYAREYTIESSILPSRIRRTWSELGQYFAEVGSNPALAKPYSGSYRSINGPLLRHDLSSRRSCCLVWHIHGLRLAAQMTLSKDGEA